MVGGNDKSHLELGLFVQIHGITLVCTLTGSGGEEEEPWFFAVFADFCGVNSTTMANPKPSTWGL